MNMDKLLTLIIPTYNMERYLSTCLDSLLVGEQQAQLDVLVVNDVSLLKFIRLVGDYRAGTYLDENRALRPPFRKILSFVRCSRMSVKGPG